MQQLHPSDGSSIYQRVLSGSCFLFGSEKRVYRLKSESLSTCWTDSCLRVFNKLDDSLGDKVASQDREIRGGNVVLVRFDKLICLFRDIENDVVFFSHSTICPGRLDSFNYA